MSSQGSRFHSRLWPFAGLIALACALIVILFSGASGITQSNIQSRLEEFSSHAATEAARTGRTASLTYGQIAIEGWGYKKNAIVDDIRLEITDSADANTNKITLSTPRMQVLPDPAQLDNLFFVFADPIDVAENGQPAAVIEFSEPLKYSYYDGVFEDERTVTHTIHFPPQITITPANTGEPQGTAFSRTVITYKKNPLFRIGLMPDKNQRNTAYEFNDIKIMNGSGFQAAAASVSSRFEQQPGGDGRAQGKYTFNLKDFTLQDETVKLQSPYSLHVDLSYSGPDPMNKMDDPAATPENTDVTLNQLRLVGEEFRMKADGRFSLVSDDPLPFGAVNVNIDRVAGLLTSELVPQQVRPLLAVALQKITGQPAESLKDITIPLKREKNGVLYIGSVTFEELAASVLTGMMNTAPVSPAPAMPPAEETAPPMEVPPAEAPGDVVPAEPAAPEQDSL